MSMGESVFEVVKQSVTRQFGNIALSEGKAVSSTLSGSLPV